MKRSCEKLSQSSVKFVQKRFFNFVRFWIELTKRFFVSVLLVPRLMLEVVRAVLLCLVGTRVINVRVQLKTRVATRLKFQIVRMSLQRYLNFCHQYFELFFSAWTLTTWVKQYIITIELLFSWLVIKVLAFAFASILDFDE